MICLKFGGAAACTRQGILKKLHLLKFYYEKNRKILVLFSCYHLTSKAEKDPLMIREAGKTPYTCNVNISKHTF